MTVVDEADLQEPDPERDENPDDVEFDDTDVLQSANSRAGLNRRHRYSPCSALRAGESVEEGACGLDR